MLAASRHRSILARELVERKKRTRRAANERDALAAGRRTDAHCERGKHYFGTYRALLVGVYFGTYLPSLPWKHDERILRYAAVRAEAYRSNSLCYIYRRADRQRWRRRRRLHT